MKRLDRVTRADVKRVASDLFRRGAMASAVIGPGLKKGTLEKFFDLR
jgi:predicted Zn-dependent peptidase